MRRGESDDRSAAFCSSPDSSVSVIDGTITDMAYPAMMQSTNKDMMISKKYLRPCTYRRKSRGPGMSPKYMGSHRHESQLEHVADARPES